MSVVPKLTKRLLVFVGIGLGTLVLYLYYFIGTVNIAEVIKQTNIFYYTSAFVAFLASVFFYSLAWRSLLHSLNIRAKIRTVLMFAWAGMFFDAVVPDPGWSGDLSKFYLLSKASGQEPGRIVASVVGQKIIVMAVTVVSLISGLGLLALNYTLPSDVLIFVTVVLFLTAFSLFVVLYLSTHAKATGRILNWLIRVICFIRRGRWNPQDFRVKAEDMLNRFHEGIRILSASPKALLCAISFSLLACSFDVSVTFLTFASLGYPAPLDKILIVYALTGSLQAMGVSFLGFTEIIVSGSYTILHIPVAISVSATLLTRVVTLWFKLVVSYVVFQWAGIELLLRKSQEAKTALQNVS